MYRYIFLDLDDTLFQTLRKCPNPHDSRLNLCAILPDGTPNSYATAKQQWLWQWLNQGFLVIPVTARDLAAFRRVNLVFDEEQIINHGGVILDRHGQLDRHWMAMMQNELQRYDEAFQSVWAEVLAFCAADEGYNARVADDFNVVWYGYIKHREGTEAALAALLAMVKRHPGVRDGSVYWHLNGNNLAVLPKPVAKGRAVDYLLASYRERGEVMSFAAGDSQTDWLFMQLCDYAIVPNNTQLSRLITSVVQDQQSVFSG